MHAVPAEPKPMAGPDGSVPVGTDQLRRFLLDQLPVTEREPLEQRLLEDDQLFEELLAIEQDLVDEAAAGQLEAAEHQHLAALPGGADRIAAAEALGKVCTANRAARAEHRPRRWRRWSAWLAAAAVLIVAAGLAALWWQASGGSLDLGSQQPAHSYVLPAAGLRGEVTVLPVSSTVDRVGLLLELPADLGDGPWQVVLQAPDGSTLARWQGLTATRHPWGRVVAVELAAVQLPTGFCRLLLLAPDASEPAQRYRLTVQRSTPASMPTSGG